MSVIYRVRVELSGWNGGPGVNTFFGLGFEEGDANEASLNNFAQGIKAVYQSCSDLLSSDVLCTWDGTVDKLNIADAALMDRTGGLDEWTVVASAGNSAESRATQLKMQFKTDRLRGRRFLQGGIFFGPVRSEAVTYGGDTAPSAAGRLISAFDGLLDVIGVNLAVYGQPTRPETPPGPGDPPNNRDGVAGYVQNVGVMRVPAVLRRRRD